MSYPYGERKYYKLYWQFGCRVAEALLIFGLSTYLTHWLFEEKPILKWFITLTFTALLVYHLAKKFMKYSSVKWVGWKKRERIYYLNSAYHSQPRRKKRIGFSFSLRL